MALPMTPGRRARGEKPYFPFNPKPRDVGTRTGQPMPKDVPFTQDGFEDPNAFFTSPNNETTIRSIAITTATSTKDGTSTKKGRLSQLAGEDSGEEYAEDLLMEDDDLDAGLTTPGPYFADKNPPPSVTLPRRSQIPPPSPSVGFDDLPSPRKRKSTIGVKLNPTSLSASRPAGNVIHSPPPTSRQTGNVIHLTPPDDMNLGVDELEESITSPALNRTKNKSLRKSVAVEDDDDDGVEMGRAAQGRLSMASRKSVNGVIDPTADTDDEQASEMGEPSFRFDETAHVGADTTFGIGDDMDRNSEELEGVEELEDASLEEAALAAEEGSEGEDGQVAPSREREKHLRPAVKKRKKLVDPPRAVITKRRTRLSRLENGDPDGVHGDFECRRSGRLHFKPLAYWRGEKFEYQRGVHLPIIKEVVHIPQEHIEPFAARHTRHRTGRSQSTRPGANGHAGSFEPEEFGWDNETNPIGKVKEYPSGREIERRLAFPRAMLTPKEVEGANFKYQKVFGEDQFIAGGVVYIPVGSDKPGKFSKDNAYIFYVIQGAVQVTVHRTSFIMAPGGSFLVPRGNLYTMVNVSPTNEAQLFFSQARKLRAGEEEEAALTRRPHEAEVPPADEGSEDEIDEQPVRRKAEGGKKRK